MGRDVVRLVGGLLLDFAGLRRFGRDRFHRALRRRGSGDFWLLGRRRRGGRGRLGGGKFGLRRLGVRRRRLGRGGGLVLWRGGVRIDGRERTGRSDRVSRRVGLGRASTVAG